MKVLVFIKTFLTTIFLFLVLVVGILVYISSKTEFYGWKLLIVKSGSMEPAIKTGSLIFISKEPEYKKSNIVTFGAPNRTDTLITHRIVEIEGDEKNRVIRTKGDFNQIEDEDKAAYASIVGKYQFGIPYVGYVVSFAKTPPGVVLLVIIPGTIIIYDEIQNIKKHGKAMLSKRKQKKESDESETMES